MKPMINKEAHLHALEVVAKAYCKSRFDTIFPLLAEDCVWESQWRLDAERGRDQVIRYFQDKEEVMRGHDIYIRAAIVELVGTMNLAPGQGSGGQPMSVGLLYPEGKLCIYMEQFLNDQVNGILIDLTMNEDDLITRIDLCNPAFFRFQLYEK